MERKKKWIEMDDLGRLKTCLKKKFEREKINKCLLEGKGEIIINAAGLYTVIEKHGECQLIQCYYATGNKPVYELWIDKDNVIADIV